MIRNSRAVRTDIQDNAKNYVQATLAWLREAALALPAERRKKVESAELVLGARTSDIRRALDEFAPKIAMLSVDDLLRFVQTLLDTRTFEARQIAYELLALNGYRSAESSVS